MATLTDKERLLLAAIAEGMDSPGSGWLHEITPFENPHVCAGVLGSLVEKGLATSDEDDEGPMTCFYVEITDEGTAALAED